MGDTDDFYEGDGTMESLPTSPEVTYNWVDITADFFKYIQDLHLGELLHDGHLFGLFEAMSAIEMMDPKMDAGMLCNRGNPKPLNFQQAVMCGKLKIENLEPSEIIGIIDATVACIVSWLEGHSLAQTVFTNVYLHQPHSIIDKPLKAFCIAVYKLLDCIRDCINKAQVFEEEDFLPMVYGYRLGSNLQSGNTYDASLEVSEQKCISMLREQEEELNKKARSQDDEAELWAALAARIRFTRMFYQALLLITKRDSQSGADCVALLNGCSEMMKVIIKTAGKGSQPLENSDSPNPMGFEPMINQRLLPPTFPRYTRIKPRAEALQYFDELVTRLRHAWKITSCTNFHTALDFFMEFSRQRACILSRSALQLLYLSPSPATTASMVQNNINTPQGQRPQHAFIEILRESIKSFVNPPALNMKPGVGPNPPVREFVENFLARCVRPFAVLLQVCGHNRARQRDKLALLLDDFATLQEEADSVDALVSGAGGPPRACFGTWLLYHVLRVMIAYLLSGLELELYSVHEYHYIFWYLYEFLYGWLLSALGRAEGLAAERKDGKKAVRKKKRSRPYAREGLMCQVMQNMCGGYFKALVAFKLQGKIRQPQSEFDNEAVRYKHRFAPLSVLTPPQVHYHEFCELTQPLQYENPVILYVAGCKHFQQARTFLETITIPDQEVTDLLKVAKTNFVVLKLLAGGHKKDSTTPPEFDFSVHRHFPIIKLV
ncbi:N-alpha-acetyltransferase 35, NatC auxiliary subunit [Melitaea cinxia]|uniref:N-alpha-acetyltransferase 35, NatC auxiliary subunit n=1 Tax=Melitaea cinxia TaxID=113334 RepID=UPI001E274832|nr:N-alpha-acetyltransferase 35, NatC auxiliary subunit [Melitaea cinxia]